MKVAEALESAFDDNGWKKEGKGEGGGEGGEVGVFGFLGSRDYDLRDKPRRFLRKTFG